MDRNHWKARGFQRGFTLVELAVATVILLVGVVAVMQLVPAAIQSNLNNRNDTTSAVAAQRLRDLMVSQALDSTTLTDPSGQFPCGGGACMLGIGAPGVDTFEGSPLAAVLDGRGNRIDVVINFNAGRVNGYNFIYVDANDPSGTRYDVRWAVITSRRAVGVIPDTVVAKRIIIGARRTGTRQPTVVTFSSWVSR